VSRGYFAYSIQATEGRTQQHTHKMVCGQSKMSHWKGSKEIYTCVLSEVWHETVF